MGKLFSKSSKTKAQDISSAFDEFLKNVKNERIIPQKYITMIQSYLKRGDTRRAVYVIRDALKEIEKVPINVAVTGEAGAGKSSFINALRGVRNDEDNAAPTGVIQTTEERVSYKHPVISNVVIWDLPGTGTVTFPAQKYPKEMKFDEYDCFIILSCTRFKKNDAQLAKLIHKMKKNLYFVRTKVDNDLHNQKLCKPNNFNRDHVLQLIQDDCLQHLKKAEVADPRVFLISNLDVSDYDFSELAHTLSRELPAQKRLNFMLSLPSITNKIIEHKMKVLMQKIWLEAIIDFVLGIFSPESINDNDEGMFRDTLNKFRILFSLDDTSLRRMAQNLKVSVEELKLGMKSAHLLTCEKGNYQNSTNTLKYFSVSEHILIPSICITKKVLVQVYVLYLVAEDAKTLLKNEKIFRYYVDSLQA
ncbi:interferon-gamma-inducible GTPase 10-like [Dasypus novemcinctus]|uniref:interferon-gamma-inducible GTPase 10-like n=1 Tax=Dasypus novemcinctus TaxID=9361 RepID=UPI000328B562|nr:interferon-gamma-inducible GTPase 10-like [Dasypus novemcinctus]